MLLRTLGEVRLEGAANDLFGRRKDLTLLAYLARKAPRPVQRIELADLLWEDRDEARARQSLRQALLELKRVVGQGLATDAEQARLDPHAVRLDSGEFESALAEGRLQDAVGWWRGDFLAGVEEIGGEALRVWLEVERETLRRSLGFALDRLAADSAAKEEWDAAVEWAERWTRFLADDERGHIRLVETLCLAGRAPEARARHTAFSARLRTDLEREPSPEFRALGPRIERELSRAQSSHRPGSAALFTPDLVGRTSALAELEAAWEAALGGHPTLVLIEGETGAGKTRLTEEFIRQTQAHAAAVAISISVRAQGLSGEPVSAALLARLALAPGLAAASPATLAAIAARVPGVRNRFPDLPAVTGGVGLDAALAEAVSVIAEEQPLLLFFDDAEHADAAALDAIAGLARAAAGRVLSIVAIGEGDHAAGAVAALTVGTRARRLKLSPLAPAHVDSLLASMLVLPPAERRSLAARLHDEAGGNPLYTIELTAALVDEGVLAVGEQGAWILHPDRWSASSPAGLRAMMDRRTSGLSDDARTVAEAVARLEPPAEDEAARESAGLSPRRFDAGRDELMARRLLRAASPPASDYRFHHQLVRRAFLDAANLRRDALAREQAGVASAKRRRRALMALAAAVAAAAVVAATVGLPAVRRLAAPPQVEAADPRQVLVVAPEIAPASPPADSAAARSFHAALERALATRTASASLIHATLGRMRRRDTISPPDRLTAREVATRAGVRLLLVPSLIRSDGRLTVAYRIERTANGETIRARERGGEEAAHAGGPIAGLMETVERDVAAAASAVPRLDPLPPVTTASLDALRAYASGLRLSNSGDGAGRVMLRRAIALDSAFASAQAMLAYLAWFDYDQRAAEGHAAAALRALDGLPPTERLKAMLDAANAREDWPTAIDCAWALIELDPAAANPWHNLGQLFYFNRAYSAAVDAYDSASARTPGSLPVALLINRATVVARVGRIREAVKDYEAAFAADPAILRHPFVNHEYGAALVRLGRSADARAAYGARLASTPADRAGALRSLALLEAHEGRFARARELLDDAVTGSTAASDTLGAVIARLLRSEVAMTQGDSALAMADLPAVERYAEAKPLPYEVVAHAVKLLARARATPRAAALLARLEAQTTAISGTARARLLIARGEVLLAGGRARDGRAAVEEALALDPTPEAKESAAFAAAAANDPVQAARRYDSLAAGRGIDWDGHVVIELGKYLAARAWERAGYPDRARPRYQAFLTDWSAAPSDSSLPAVRDARRRLMKPGRQALSP